MQYAIIFLKCHGKKGMNSSQWCMERALPYSKWITLLSLGKYNLTTEIVSHPAVNDFEIAEAPVFRQKCFIQKAVITKADAQA